MTSDRKRKGVVNIKEIAKEVGQTVRAALQSWPGTIRLCVLIAFGVTVVAIWTHHYL